MSQTLLLLVVEHEGEAGVCSVFLWALHWYPKCFCVQTSHVVISQLSTCSWWVKQCSSYHSAKCLGFLMKEGAAMSITVTRVTFLRLLAFPSLCQYPRAKSNSPTSSCHSCCWQLFPVHLVVMHFQAVLCLSFTGQSHSQSLIQEPVPLPQARLCGPYTSLSRGGCVCLHWDFTPAVEGAARGCLYHHSHVFQNMLERTGSLGRIVQQSYSERPFNDVCFSFPATSKLPILSPITVMGAGLTSHMSKSLQHNPEICTLTSSNPAG